ncbi:MAG: helix-turn-helix domain-containing protein [Methanobacterium sp.]|nr:helix-turn-helix domain-containing protein [Methanobacterium sp.]
MGRYIETIRKYIERQQKKMKTVNKSYKYRIYPNKEQQDILEFNNR